MSYAPLKGTGAKPIMQGTIPTRHISEAGKPDMTKLLGVLVVYSAICFALFYFVA